MTNRRWRAKQKEWQNLVHDLTKKLTDEGKIIEAGFVGFKMHVFPDDSWRVLPEEQELQLRMAFFAGAHHFYSTMNSLCDDEGLGLEPTDQEIGRIQLMTNELQEFIKIFERLHTPTAGNA